MSNKTDKRNFWTGLFSGGISGAMAIMVTYPTEYLKTKMQLYESNSRAGMLNCAKNTIKKYGFKGFYRGLDTLLYFSIPKVGVRFGFNEFFLRNVYTKGTRTDIFAAGFCSGIFEALFVVTPMETLKVKLIHDKLQREPQYRNVFHGSYRIWKEEGFSGIYRGSTATIARQSSNAGIRFLVYDETKHLMETYLNFLPNIMILMLSGSTAGAVNVFANGPIDVIKTNMQGLDAKKYKNSWDCGVQIYKEEGFRGLYKGTVPRLTRLVMDVGLTFTFYEYVNRGLEYLFNIKPHKQV